MFISKLLGEANADPASAAASFTKLDAAFEDFESYSSPLGVVAAGGAGGLFSASAVPSVRTHGASMVIWLS